MTPPKITGLGEPEYVGKKNLFQPPRIEEGSDDNVHTDGDNTKQIESKNRIRTTISLTNLAMATIQDIQNQHRLRTGKVLPLWKVVSDAIETYSRSRKGELEQKDNSDRGPGVQKTSRASLAQSLWHEERVVRDDLPQCGRSVGE